MLVIADMSSLYRTLRKWKGMPRGTIFEEKA